MDKNTPAPPMEYIEVQGRKYEVSGYAEDGLPIIRATATSTQDGYDEDGNPKISTVITVPPFELGAEPGKVE